MIIREKLNKNELLSFAEIETFNHHLLSELNTSKSAPSDEFWEDAVKFVNQTERSGATLFSFSERSRVQSTLNYWSTLLIGKPKLTQQISLPLMLAEPDKTKAQDLSGMPSPYVGLESFTENDAAKFFGREGFLNDITKRVFESGLTIVSGPSGSGKSSVVFGGVLPALKHYTSKKVSVLALRSLSLDPIQSLLNAIKSEQSSELDEGLATAIYKKPTSISKAFSKNGEGQNLIIVDQMEELFTLCRKSERRLAFVKVLRELSKSHHVLCVLRSDFLVRLRAIFKEADFTVPQNAIKQPPLMTSTQLYNAISKPAQSAGLIFDDGIIEDMISKVRGDQSALPLLQFALRNLWDAKDRNRITRAAYKEVGDPLRALANAADNLYDDMSIENQKTTQDIFKALVIPDKGHEFVRRRVTRDSLYDIANEDRAKEILEKFVREGLLKVTNGASPDLDVFEVSHEALIRNWERLTQWLAESKANFEKQNYYTDLASHWAQSGEKNFHLLDESRLEEAQQYSGSSQVLDDFITESKTRIKWSEKRELQRLYMTIFVLASFALIAAAGWWSSESKNITIENKEKALIKKNIELSELMKDEIKHNKSLLEYAEATKEDHARIIRKIQSIGTNPRPRNKAGWLTLNNDLREFFNDWAERDNKLREAKGMTRDKVDKTIKLLEDKEELLTPQANRTAKEATSEIARELPSNVNIAERKRHSIGDGLCEGTAWLGYEKGWTVTGSSPEFHPDNLNRGDKITTKTYLKLREALPDAENNSAPKIATLVPGTELEISGEIFEMKRPSGVQYWAPVKTNNPACFTVYIQISNESLRDEAEVIRTKLQSEYGYYAPGVEHVKSSQKSTEVRYFNNAATSTASQLSETLSSIIQSERYGVDIARLTPPKNLKLETQGNVLEIWIAENK